MPDLAPGYPPNILDEDKQGVLGRPLPRVDGPLKVSGSAAYAYEYAGQGKTAYGFIVGATVPNGKILAIGTPAELKHRVQRESIFRLELDRLDGGPATLAKLPGVVAANHASDDGGPVDEWAVRRRLHDVHRPGGGEQRRVQRRSRCDDRAHGQAG